MKFKVVFSDKALRQIKKLDKYTSKLIIAWIKKHLDGTTDPCIHGKGLTSNRSGQWRYRIGDYRLVVDIQDKDIIVLILEIGHRKGIY